jgi:hypothetical protein
MVHPGTIAGISRTAGLFPGGNDGFFIRLSKYQQSGFFLNNLDELAGRLDTCRSGRIPTLLLGVSYALLDLAERFPMDLSGLTIMETGGMKGRRREITRQELHSALCQAFQVPGIHSEYGMTELFSQAYRIPGLSTDHIAPFRPARTMRAYTGRFTIPFARWIRAVPVCCILSTWLTWIPVVL